ncbi:ATP-binding cassette domain-containing protein, partial [Planococcus sp. SIMBA_143]
SGKSTLLQLLLNFYSPDQGAVFVNDVSLKDIDQESLWEHANVVLQENHFFYGTVKDNLMLVSDDLTDGELESVLAIVKLDHFSLED